MRLPKYLLAGEPIHTFIPGLDTGVTLAAEIISRGFQLDYCDLSVMNYQLESADYLAHLKVSRIRSVDSKRLPAFELEEWRETSVNNYDIILQRKDPPVDDAYRGHCAHFMKVSERIVQVNNPALTWKLSEHLLPQEFPEHSVPTFLCTSFAEFEKQVRQRQEDTVSKPMNLFSGVGVEFFKSETPLSTLQAYWDKWKPEIVVQPYLEAITSIGDLRILTINDKVVGSVLRKPKTGSRLANLHQGGSAHYFAPTHKQLIAVEAIVKKLCPQGLYLLGIDFIGDLVSEINITCPSALPQINEVNGIRGEMMIVDELEKLRLTRK